MKYANNNLFMSILISIYDSLKNRIFLTFQNSKFSILNFLNSIKEYNMSDTDTFCMQFRGRNWKFIIFCGVVWELSNYQSKQETGI
jgi:hypothetical protein